MDRSWFHLSTKRLCIMGILTALKIILERVLSISVGDYLRVSFSFIPVAVAGMLMGPMCSTLVAAAADLLGTLLSGQAPFPGLTLVAALTGFFYGAFLYRREITLGRAMGCMLAVTLVCSLVLNSLCLYVMGILPHAPDAFWLRMTPRMIRCAVQYPINVALLLGTSRLLRRLPARLRIA